MPTCVWIEPARSDCMLDLSDLAPKSMNKWTRSMTYSRRCFLKDFSFKSEVNGLPKVPQSRPREPNGAPMAYQGHPKIITLAAFLGEVVQRGSRAAIWKHFGSIWKEFWEYCSYDFEQLCDTLGTSLNRFLVQVLSPVLYMVS